MPTSNPITPNGIQFLAPSADGSSGWFLKTDGSKNLSFAAVTTHTQNTDTGTTQMSFQIDSGNSGPRIKNSSGVLQVRNAADSAAADLSAGAATLSGKLGVGVTPVSRYTAQILPSASIGLGVIGAAGDYANSIECGASTSVAGGLYWRNTTTPNRFEITTIGGTNPVAITSGVGPSPSINLIAHADGRVSVGTATNDGVSALQIDGVVSPKSYTVATLPTAGTARRIAYASNGRKNGEGAGSGTGVLVFDDSTNWKAVDTGQTVAA